jgi:hypothetical protein
MAEGHGLKPDRNLSRCRGAGKLSMHFLSGGDAATHQIRIKSNAMP